MGLALHLLFALLVLSCGASPAAAKPGFSEVARTPPKHGLDALFDGWSSFADGWLLLDMACVLLLAPPSRAEGEKKAGKVTVTGEVIDSACYIKMGAKGESHRDCAQKCGDAGIPLALLEDGTNNVIWLASVADMETPNAMLKPHAGRRVTVTGTWAERGGAKILLVAKVAPAAK